MTRYLRNSAPRTHQSVRDASGVVPGVIPLPLDRSVSDAAQLARVFGFVDDLSDETQDFLSGVDRRERIVAHDKEVAERAEKQRTDALRGIGVRDVRSKLPLLLDTVGQARELVAPEEIEARAGSLVAKALPGLDPVSADAALEFAAPHLIAGMTERNRGLQEEGRRFTTDSILEGAAALTDPAQIEETIRTIATLNPERGEDGARRLVVRRVLNAQAEAGTIDTFDQLASLAPDLDAADVAVMRTQLVRRVDDANLDAFRNVVAAGIEGARAGDVPFADLRRRVEENTTAHPSDRRNAMLAIDAAESQHIQVAQRTSENALMRGIVLGRWISGDPQQTVDDVVRRMDIADPKDPEFIDAAAGARLLGEIKQKTTFDARVVKVQTGAPLTREDGPALLKVLGSTGVVSGTDRGSSFVLTGITDPTAFARVASQSRLVPADASDLIVAGLGSNDPQQVATALTQFSALGLVDEGLAVSILPTSNNPVALQAQMRAHYVLSRLKAEKVPLDNATIASAAAAYVPHAMRLDDRLLSLTRNQIRGTVYAGDPTVYEKLPSDLVRDLNQKIRDQTRRDIRDAILSMGGDLDSLIGNFGGPRLHVVPGDVANTYEQALEAEYRIQASLIPDTGKAAAAAKKWALHRTLEKHPPTVWGGVLRFGREGEPRLDSRLMRRDLVREFGAASARELWRDYVPEFVSNGDDSGWVFRSLNDPGNVRRYANTGNPIVVNPYAVNPGIDVPNRGELPPMSGPVPDPVNERGHGQRIIQ